MVQLMKKVCKATDQMIAYRTTRNVQNCCIRGKFNKLKCNI